MTESEVGDDRDDPYVPCSAWTLPGVLCGPRPAAPGRQKPLPRNGDLTMVVHSLRKVLAVLALGAGLAVVVGTPAIAAIQSESFTATIFSPPYSAQP